MNPIVTVDDARAAGFHGFLAVGKCIVSGLPADQSLKQCGVYLVCAPNGLQPDFISPDNARKEGNVISPWTIDRLEKKWVDGAEVLYIGLAGAKSPRTLRKRLRDLLRHAGGHAINHTGGEILWQLEGYDRFLICWLPTGPPPFPLKLERSLIQAFKLDQGKRPFANRRD